MSKSKASMLGHSFRPLAVEKRLLGTSIVAGIPVWAIFVAMALLCAGSGAWANKILEKTIIKQSSGYPPSAYTSTSAGFHGRDEAIAGCAAFEAALPFVPRAHCTVGQWIAGSYLYAAHIGWVNAPYFPQSYSFYWYTGYFCLNNMRWIPPDDFETGNGWCATILNRIHLPEHQCTMPGASNASNSHSVGNPIQPMTGAKTQEIVLGHWLGEKFSIHYNTQFLIPGNITGADLYPAIAPSFGTGWHGSHHRQGLRDPATDGGTLGLKLFSGKGHWRTFVNTGGVFKPSTGGADQLKLVTNNTWQYFDMASSTLELSNLNGIWHTVAHHDGRVLSYAYSAGAIPGTAPMAGLLISITDSYGRVVKFDYELSSKRAPRIYRITAPDGRQILVGYSASDQLQSVQWPGERPWTFLYEKPALPWALTGVLNPDSVRESTYDYNARGLAISTELAGGINRYATSYGSEPRWRVVETYDPTRVLLWRDHYWDPPVDTIVTRPNGSSSAVSYTTVGDKPRMTSQSQPAGSGCAASTSQMGYDERGSLAYKDDFNGYRTCYANDPARGLELTRVEGLGAGAKCDAPLQPSAALPEGSRKVSTQWHPLWAGLKTAVAEPGRLSWYIYNGQPDPFTGTISRCVLPAGTGTLPDGSPIAVLCKQVQRATTDADGSQGFLAAAEPGAIDQVEQWTYNATGQVLSHDGPRTDVNDRTTYTYYTDTVFAGADPQAVGHTRGDLAAVTNALGQVTRFTQYDKLGQVLESIDANGVVTAYAYDARQRLSSVSVGGQRTRFEYWPAGPLKRATQPDGVSFIQYTYDDARRLRLVQDHLGNSIRYTLDETGNRKVETVSDPGGQLRRELSREFDALGRVQKLIGREVAP